MAPLGDKKIVIIGAAGMVGHTMLEFFSEIKKEALGVTRSSFDILRQPFERLEPYLEGAAVVVNCAAIIQPRLKEFDCLDVITVNSVFPHNLLRFCCARDIPLIHISTDGVFSGRRGNYSELDAVDCTDMYGLSKAAGEPALAMVLRATIVGEEDNSSRSLLAWVKSKAGAELSGYINCFWNGITTLKLAQIIDDILARKLYQPGVYHLYSPRSLSKHELILLINEVYDLGIEVIPVASDQPANRTLTSIRGLVQKLGIEPIEEQLGELREFHQRPRALRPAKRND